MSAILLKAFQYSSSPNIIANSVQKRESSFLTKSFKLTASLRELVVEGSQDIKTLHAAC